MASKSRKSGKSGRLSNTMMGLITGLILGVGAAVAVTLFVTEVPMPFVDRASREPTKTLLPDLRDAPDPNVSLYGKDGPAGTVSSGQNTAGATPLYSTAPLPGPLPGTGPSANGQAGSSAAAPGNPPSKPPRAAEHPSGHPSPDALGSLIASLGSKPERSTQPAPRPSTPSRSAAPESTQTVYYLQAGAFHSSKDAEAMKARILMMGLSAQVQPATVNGTTINRVRVGPFKGIDAMNRARAKLGDDQIASSVVRP